MLKKIIATKTSLPTAFTTVLPTEIEFSFPTRDQKRLYVCIPKSSYAECLFKDVEAFIVGLKKTPNKQLYYQSIDKFHSRALQIQHSPEALVQGIDTTHWISALLLDDGSYTPTTSGCTLYNCGRPESPPLTEQQAAKIVTLTSQLQAYQLSTVNFPVKSLATPKPVWNPAIRQVLDEDVPEVFETLLQDCVDLIADERLTDNYSLRQSIQFLLARHKINAEDPNYTITSSPRSGEPSQWLTSLATAMVRKESGVNSKIQEIGKEGWEEKLQSFLTDKWSLPPATDLMPHIATLHPSINPRNSASFLQKKSGLELPVANYTDLQLALLAGLEICIKSDLTKFILDFTAGAKGRLRNLAGANGQCGSEYSNQALLAISAHQQAPDTPTSISEWVKRQIYHLRFNLLHDHYLSGTEQRTETFFFDEIMHLIESLDNPNTGLMTQADVRSHTGASIQEALGTCLTPEKCVDHLQTMIAQNKSVLADLAPTIDEQRLISKLSESTSEIYRFLSKLGLLDSPGSISHTPILQVDQVNRLVASIFILPPTMYLPTLGAIGEPEHPLHQDTMTLLRRKLLTVIAETPHLLPLVKETCFGILDTKEIEAGIIASLKSQNPQRISMAVLRIKTFINSYQMQSDILNSNGIIETLLDIHPSIIDTESENDMHAIFHALSEKPNLRLGMSETIGLMEHLSAQCHRELWQIVAKNLIKDPQTYDRFSEFPELTGSLLPSLDPITLEQMSRHKAQLPLLVNHIDELFPFVSHCLSKLNTVNKSNPEEWVPIQTLLIHAFNESSKLSLLLTHPNGPEALFLLLDHNQDTGFQLDAIETLVTISKTHHMILTLFAVLPQLITGLTHYPSHQRSLATVLFNMSVSTAKFNDTSNNQYFFEPGVMVREMLEFKDKFLVGQNVFLESINSLSCEDPFANTLLKIARLNFTDQQAHPPSIITSVIPLHSDTLTQIRQLALDTVLSNEPTDYKQKSSALRSVFSSFTSIAPPPHRYSIDRNFGIYIETTGIQIPQHFYAELGMVVLSNWNPNTRRDSLKKDALLVINDFVRVSGNSSPALVKTCLAILKNEPAHSAIFASALATLKTCVENSQSLNQDCINVFIKDFQIINTLFKNQSNPSDIVSILYQLSHIKAFAQTVVQSDSFISELTDTIVFKRISGNVNSDHLGLILVNCIKGGQDSISLDLRFRILSRFMFNFLYVIHNYNAPLAIALLEALTKNPATYPFLYNDLIDSPSQPKIVQIIQGLQDANSRENVIVLLERMTQSETNVLPQCLKAVPDLVRDLLPLLDSPEIMNHFAHIIVQAVEKHPPSRKQLKTPSALQQLIRLYIDSSEEPHHRDLYILLKFALGKKVMGIWLRDSDVQDRVTPIEIARLRHRCADNSALYRLL